MTMPSYRLLVLFLFAPLVLAACASSNGLQPAASMLDSSALGARDTLAGIPTDAAGWPSRDWWKAYGDPQLDALIEQAVAASPTLATARARIEQADQYERLLQSPAPCWQSIRIFPGEIQRKLTMNHQNHWLPYPLPAATINR